VKTDVETVGREETVLLLTVNIVRASGAYARVFLGTWNSRWIPCPLFMLLGEG
jgi:hypothetical protein